MTTSTTEPNLDISALSVLDILGAAPSLAEITAQLKDPSKRKAKAKPRGRSPQKPRHDFASPILHPPRGPDLQIGIKELKYSERLKQDIDYFRHQLRSSEARESFLLNILQA